MSDRRFHLGFRARPRPAVPGAHESAPDRSDAVTAPGDGDSEVVDESLIDNAIYVDGRRVSSPTSLNATYAELGRRRGALAWIGLYRPSVRELNSLAAEFELHELAVEDAIKAHQRPKVERYGSTMFVVLRAAQYFDENETVDFGELHVFIGRNFVITVRHSESPDLSTVRHRMENDPDLLAVGTEAVLYAILDKIVDGYAPVVDGLENDIDEIETQVFGGDPAVSRRIYALSREVIEFQRATDPLRGAITSLETGFDKERVDTELQRYLRDVSDHVERVCERVDGFRQLLREIMSVNATLIAQRQNSDMQHLTEASLRQNDDMKKISSWAAIFFAPSLVGTVYGMNFTHMPALDWYWGLPASLVIMVGGAFVLYGLFKWRGWL
ncbi:magnesium and cobalt transport protein CorA [Spelaeicoccus albus]|uniref:Magnesium transporter n=1 Tax=Spelaeicoccus albus TaxID=1280376 RepID=A0A7Z0AA09_9MICO|nr:magnesium and cobalt transport protein CorA [Spelaeicoccus albus]NYI66300.1 magnesium transporter [Spelaeicoccus albus]